MKNKNLITSILITFILILSITLTGCVEPDPYYDGNDYDNNDNYNDGNNNGGSIISGETWTFMIYMSDCDLETFGISDINEMESVGSGGNVNIVVQFDRWYSNSYKDDISNGDWTTAKRFLITNDYDTNIISSSPLIDLGEINSGDPQELVDFVQWSMYYYPADHYFLDLWDHGGGIEGVCYEQSIDPQDKLTIAELKSALQSITNYGTNKLDIIGFDACLMSTIEVANELAPFADYFIASEITEPGTGWNYIFLENVKKNSLSTIDVGQVIIDTFVAQRYQYPYFSYTLALLDLSKINSVISNINSLSQSISSAGSTELQSNIQQIRRASQPIILGLSSEAVDLVDFIQRLQIGSGDASIREISGHLLQSLDDLIVYFSKSSGTDDIDVSNAHGVSIYSPEFSAIFSQEAEYRDLSFDDDSSWDEALQDYYDVTTPEQVIYFVENSLFYEVSDDDGDGWYDSFWIACDIGSLQDNTEGYLSVDIYDDLGYLLDYTEYTFTISSDEITYLEIGDIGYSLIEGDEPGFYQMVIYLCLGTEYNPDYFQDYAESDYEWLEIYAG